MEKNNSADSWFNFKPVVGRRITSGATKHKFSNEVRLVIGEFELSLQLKKIEATKLVKRTISTIKTKLYRLCTNLCTDCLQTFMVNLLTVVWTTLGLVKSSLDSFGLHTLKPALMRSIVFKSDYPQNKYLKLKLYNKFYSLFLSCQHRSDTVVHATWGQGENRHGYQQQVHQDAPAWLPQTSRNMVRSKNLIR